MAGKKNVSLQEKEKLISIIKEQPAVYDATLPEYKDAQFQENIWLSVAEAMGRDDISGPEWKKKWRNQRDSYVKKKREMRTTKSGQAASRKQKWPLMDLMYFLDRYTEEISTDSNFQQACHGEGNSGDSGDEDSVSVSERSEVSSFQHDTEDEAQNGRGPSPTPSSSTMSSSVPVKPRTGSQLTPKSVPAKSAASGKGKKRPFQHDSQLDKAIVELIHVQAKNRESLDSMLKTDEEPKSVARSFLESCILKMEKLPQEKQSYLQLQISQLFFNAENPDIDPIPITPLPQKKSPLPNQFIYMEDQSSSASNIITRAMEMANDMSDCYTNQC